MIRRKYTDEQLSEAQREAFEEGRKSGQVDLLNDLLDLLGQGNEITQQELQKRLEFIEG